MIIEHAILSVASDKRTEFEDAFDEAKAIIAAMPGFVSLSLSRRVETPADYLLLVTWETLADHTEGFRGSPDYQRWKQLLHHFYDPFPIVDHYEPVHTVTS